MGQKKSASLLSTFCLAAAGMVSLPACTTLTPHILKGDEFIAEMLHQNDLIVRTSKIDMDQAGEAYSCSGADVEVYMALADGVPTGYAVVAARPAVEGGILSVNCLARAGAVLGYGFPDYDKGRAKGEEPLYQWVMCGFPEGPPLDHGKSWWRFINGDGKMTDDRPAPQNREQKELLAHPLTAGVISDFRERLLIFLQYMDTFGKSLRIDSYVSENRVGLCGVLKVYPEKGYRLGTVEVRQVSAAVAGAPQP